MIAFSSYSNFLIGFVTRRGGVGFALGGPLLCRPRRCLLSVVPAPYLARQKLTRSLLGGGVGKRKNKSSPRPGQRAGAGNLGGGPCSSGPRRPRNELYLLLYYKSLTLISIVFFLTALLFLVSLSIYS